MNNGVRHQSGYGIVGWYYDDRAYALISGNETIATSGISGTNTMGWTNIPNNVKGPGNGGVHTSVPSNNNNYFQNIINRNHWYSYANIYGCGGEGGVGGIGGAPIHNMHYGTTIMDTVRMFVFGGGGGGFGGNGGSNGGGGGGYGQGADGGDIAGGGGGYFGRGGNNLGGGGGYYSRGGNNEGGGGG